MNKFQWYPLQASFCVFLENDFLIHRPPAPSPKAKCQNCALRIPPIYGVCSQSPFICFYFHLPIFVYLLFSYSFICVYRFDINSEQTLAVFVVVV